MRNIEQVILEIWQSSVICCPHSRPSLYQAYNDSWRIRLLSQALMFWKILANNYGVNRINTDFHEPSCINREKRRYIFTWYVACSVIMEISLSSNLYIQLTISWSPVTTCHCPLTNDFKKGQQIMINTWRRRVNIWDSFHLIFYSFI